MFNGLYAVLYRELTIYRKRALKQFFSSSLSPLLFLIAFGWGFGRDVTVGGLSYISFLIPGLITMNSLNQSFAISAEINISRFYFHTFDEYLIAPVPHASIVIGEAMFGVFRGLLATIIIFVYAYIFNVTLSFNPIFIAAICLHTFIFSFLAVTTSMVVKDHSGQALVNNFVITPMIFLCGTFYPIDKLPYAFKMLVSLFPLTYSTKVIRATLTGGEVNFIYVGLMVFYCIMFFLTSLWALRSVEA
ncbi:ABC transporter permease [Candidatus Magnetominusculus dajiuhuensis]|uniref:ABC transporter permease n=1 Tax=Candidatus Magnetominusculus dajiuhuensis TaxID=3137712 RepID=UPI003B42A963